ncbi:MAG: hypothetical protein EXR29_00195 [Betaproteobacteria bacterium]|nr:hypothetical protein [Betaproteobacteria bacterium]
MPILEITNLPKALYRKLWEQATRHQRSMSEEALAVLEHALGAQAPPPFRGRFALTDKFLDKVRREVRK